LLKPMSLHVNLHRTWCSTHRQQKKRIVPV